jgi:hypothetical protein
MTMVKKNWRLRWRQERDVMLKLIVCKIGLIKIETIRRCKSFVSLDVNDDFDEMGDENYDNKSLGHGNHFGKSRNHRHEGTKKDGQFIQ